MNTDTVMVPRALLADALGLIRLARHQDVRFDQIEHVVRHLEVALAQPQVEPQEEGG